MVSVMVDFAIITAKLEEFEAVLKRFPEPLNMRDTRRRRLYTFRKAPISTGGHYSVAIVRCVSQGLSEAQNVATDLIEDLDPKWILVVGIGGGVPSEDLFLGDVVLATHVHDFSLGADTPEGRQHAISGYQPPKDVCTFVAALSAKKEGLREWSSAGAIGLLRPDVPDVALANWTGDSVWDSRIKRAIEFNSTRTVPKFLDGPIASSDDLLKDHRKLQERLSSDRRILAVDMETAGVAKACNRHDKNVWFLAIRGVSDIVGVPRSSSWTDYACNVAASFAAAFIGLNSLPRIEKSAVTLSSPAAPVGSILRIFEITSTPLPLEVMATSCGVAVDALRAELSDYFARHVLKETEEGLLQGDEFESRSTANNDGPDGFNDRVLVSLLSFIEANSREDKGVKQSRNALTLFKQLDQYQQRRLATCLFDVLDRPMKALGDKKLVEDVATVCIKATCHTDRTREEAECEARARICGLSWVYQRTGRIELAAHEADQSLSLSRSLQLSKNIAFCTKCLGRLHRMRAEESAVPEERKALLHKSVEFLNSAIQSFSKLDEYGDEDPEVGDCYSLLGRTFLVAGDLAGAERNADQASRRITDTASKDFLDLQILLGDIAEQRGQRSSALAFYTTVTERRKDGDFQYSEIVARGLTQRARVFARLGHNGARQDFQAAASIWNQHGEHDLAATADWEAILLDEKFPAAVKKALQGEKARVRVAAYRLAEEKRRQKGRGTLSQRVGHDVVVWKQLIRRAKENIGLRRRPEDYGA